MRSTENVSQLGRAPNRLPMAMRVANAMQRIGVVGLPRNYEIFYTAISGTNLELQEQLMEIGHKIDQHRLDELYSQYFARRDDEKAVLKVCNTLEEQLAESIDTLEKENISVSNFGTVLEQGKAKLTSSARLPSDVVEKITALLASATETAQREGKLAVEKMEAGSAQLNKMKEELAQYKRLAETDALSGLYNRRAFDDRLGEISKAHLSDTAIIVGDIDKFKSINDTYGHPFGDIVIKTVADTIKEYSRDDVFCARIGGEEFALISHAIDEEGMHRLAERLRIAVANKPVSDGRTQLAPGKITISFGVCHGSSATDSAVLYNQADEALYVSKRISRNRVTSFSELTVAPDRKELFLYRD